MTFILSGVVGVLVFGLLVVALVWREQKKQTTAKADGCGPGHQCQCGTYSILQQQRNRHGTVNSPSQESDKFGNG